MPTSQIRFHVGRFTTVYNNKTKKLDMMAAGDYTNSNTVDLVMIPLSDYNQTEGKNVKLKKMKFFFIIEIIKEPIKK